MTTIQTAVITKLNAEMQSEPDNTTLELVGQRYIDACSADERTAAVMSAAFDDGKTLESAIEAMSDVAEKRAKNMIGILSDAEGFKIIDDYFGVSNVQTFAHLKNVPHLTKTKSRRVNLEDFL
ncbi:hypothetical protein FACS1894208_01420 [Clostridia bacterium]|nr:hypothetical protein FACS1894208_01420 [Clostridia bacterium]